MEFNLDYVLDSFEDTKRLRPGQKVICADSIKELKACVEDKKHFSPQKFVDEGTDIYPFGVENALGLKDFFRYAYVVEEEKTEYRPFNNVDELIQRWNFLNPCTRPAYTMPLIWVKHKGSETVELITAFCKDGVEMGSSYMTWGYFFDAMVFLDNSPCGVEIQEEGE